MKIIEALKSGKIDRVAVRNRWLYWANGAEYGDEQDRWVVRESRRGRNGTKVLIVTKDEAEAVRVLLGED